PAPPRHHALPFPTRRSSDLTSLPKIATSSSRVTRLRPELKHAPLRRVAAPRHARMAGLNEGDYALGCSGGVKPAIERRRLTDGIDRKSTRLNSSHGSISYAV